MIYLKVESLLRKYILFILISLQSVFVVSVFSEVIFHPSDFLICPHYDGLKNYFTYLSYIGQHSSQDIFKFINMNYPYGDYIFYTDNTPIFAFLIKLFSTYIFDITSYSLLLYNIFFISGIVLSTFILYKIIQRFTDNLYLLFVFSLTFPWLNPQITRFTCGHHNLSLSWIILLGIYLLFKIYELYKAEQKIWKYIPYLILLCLLSSFVHVYYIILILTFIAGFFLFWIIYEKVHNRKIGSLIIAGAVSIGGSLFAFLSVLISIDKYYFLRVGKAEGYNWIEWKTKFSAFYTSYYFNDVKFFFETTEGMSYENYAYLGSFTLFFCLFLVVYFKVKKNKKFTFISIFRNYDNGMFLYFLFLASFISLMISFGPDYYIFDGQYRFFNYLNPFLYLAKVTDKVFQFRCISRFSWIFFWSFSFSVIFACSYIVKHEKAKIKWLIYGLTIFLMIDAKNMMTHVQIRVATNILHPNHFFDEINSLTKDVDFSVYQAILPIPFYHTGTDVDGYRFAIDPDDKYVEKTMQLSLKTGLPLMSAKFGRTPVSYAANLFSIFLPDTMSSDLKNKLDGRPVLVYYDHSYYDGTNINWKLPIAEPALSVYWAGKDMPAKYNMKKIKDYNSVSIYSWDLKGTR